MGIRTLAILRLLRAHTPWRFRGLSICACPEGQLCTQNHNEIIDFCGSSVASRRKHAHLHGRLKQAFIVNDHAGVITGATINESTRCFALRAYAPLEVFGLSRYALRPHTSQPVPCAGLCPHKCGHIPARATGLS